MKHHPAASIFPMMSDEELSRLANDIRKNGLVHSIVLFEDMILDGRNRFAACRLADVNPRYESLLLCDSPTAYVLSVNLERRHLTNAQRAAVAVESKALFQAEAKARQRAGGQEAGRSRPKQVSRKTDEPIRRPHDGRAMAQAAALVGIHTDTAYDMEKVKRNAPEVFEAAKRGEVRTVAQAKRMAAGEPEPPPQSGCVENLEKARTKTRADTMAFDEQVQALFDQSLSIKEIAARLGCKCNKVQTAKRRLGYVASSTVITRALGQLEGFADGCYTIRRIAPWRSASEEDVARLREAIEVLKKAVRDIGNRLNNEAGKDLQDETQESEDRAAIH